MAKTVIISNPDIRGVAGRRRVDLIAIDTNATIFEVVAPAGWFPHARAGIAAKWRIVFRQTIGNDVVWQSE